MDFCWRDRLGALIQSFSRDDQGLAVNSQKGAISQGMDMRSHHTPLRGPALQELKLFVSLAISLAGLTSVFAHSVGFVSTVEFDVLLD